MTPLLPNTISRKRKRRITVVSLSTCFALMAAWVTAWNLGLAQLYLPSQGIPDSLFLQKYLLLDPPYQSKTNHRDDYDDVDPDAIPPRREPTHTACQDTDGILHIQMGDAGGAAGTIFFQFVMAQILYAERVNLTPWVHLSNYSYVIYDETIHNPAIRIDSDSASTTQVGVSFRAKTGAQASIVQRPYGHWRDKVPGPLDLSQVNKEAQELYFPGTGVWEHYFQPVSDFVPGDRSCQDKLYVTLSLEAITPGLHRFAEWAPRCWRYAQLPDYIAKYHLPLHEWLGPMRETAHRVVSESILPRDVFLREAVRVNPFDDQNVLGALGLHIRHSDKASHRRVVDVAEFLPFVEVYVRAGGQHVYVATDSDNVLTEIHATWPDAVTSKIRTMDDEGHGEAGIVRSTDEQAVFDLASHHVTNKQILVEIYALAFCDFLVHGFSAVSEAALWIKGMDLHHQSVNLEDEDHLSAQDFEVLVNGVKNGLEGRDLPHPVSTDPWWDELTEVEDKQVATPTHKACGPEHKGVLWISSVPSGSAAGSAFFRSILNQLEIAAAFDYVPWIHLQPDAAEFLYDAKVHGSTASHGSTKTMEWIDLLTSANDNKLVPAEAAGTAGSSEPVGNGIWNTYMDPVSDYLLGDTSCQDLPIVRLSNNTIESVIPFLYPEAIRAWRYDQVPDTLWNPSGLPLADWMQPMRQRASERVRDFYRFRPAIRQRADEANPITNDQVCMGVHLRNADKTGKFRNKIKAHVFEDYMKAFVQAGGDVIYLATDSLKAFRYIQLYFDGNVTSRIHSQGRFVVRTIEEYAAHVLDDHHRVNSEVLVDIAALSKCQFLLHTYSTVAEAAIYMNPSLQNTSINLEDPNVLSPDQFELFVRRGLGQNATEVDPMAVWADDGRFQVERVDETILVRHEGNDRPACASNAIVYLAQKVHSSYGRDSFGSLLQSLRLLHENYLSLHQHMDSVNVFIFHTGDFGPEDLLTIEEIFGPGAKGLLRMVDLSISPHWARPASNLHDNPRLDWYAYPLFSEGYRRMMHWFAIDIWKFFARLNEQMGCSYRYIWRMDEDSFLHSPIAYDMFDFMQSNNYEYGFRMCSYEMQVTQRMWTLWGQRRPDFVPKRPIELDMCGFYNNFFVADLHFFLSEPVQDFLNFLDDKGHIYRRRLGDLMIHSMTVYGFALPERIHRFLDFTYEHNTVNQTSGCLAWGGIQAGYEDPSSAETLKRFQQTMLEDRKCPGNSTILNEPDLSPTYQHIPESLKGKIGLLTVTAGRVELPAGKGILSG